MSKMLAVLKREYVQAVRKKSFLIMTILGPFLMAGITFIPAAVAMKGLGEKKIAVLDGTSRLKASVEKPVDPEEKGETADDAADPLGGGQDVPKQMRRRRSSPIGRLRFEYVAVAEGKDLKAEAAPYLQRLRGEDVPKERKLDGVLLIPASTLGDTDVKLTYFSRSSTELMVQERLARIVGRTASRLRLVERGFDPVEIDKLLKDVRVESVQVTKSGEEKKGGEMNFLAGFVFVALLFIPILIYGQEVMRGIIQEKSDRIVEILISSMSPLELLSGKIFGMAAVGLTQMAIWAVMAGALAVYAGAMAAMAGFNLSQFFRPVMAFYFILFYLLGYLLYVCVYAVGGAIVNTEKEAQNFLGPIVMILMVPWFLLMPIVMNPESTMAVVFSLIPIYTPITMFVRVLVSDPPMWQVALSIGMAIATIYLMFWLTAKIFRVGILSYGKRPTVPELWRWLKVA